MGAKRSSQTEIGENNNPSKKFKSKIDENNTGSKSKNIKTPGEKLPKDTAATRKERKIFRKQQKSNYELSHKAMKLWEKLRITSKDSNKKEKHEIVAELLKLMTQEGQKISKLSYAHDTSRVLQSCLKQGNAEQRCEVYQGIKEDVLEMSKNKYAKNIIWKMVLYGTPDQRNGIIHKFTDIPKLLKKPLPASVIEYAYNTFANEDQRRFLTSQLYGNMFAVLKRNNSATLEQVLKDNPEKKSSILSSFKDVLKPLIDKEVMLHTIVHRGFYDFFKCCDEPKIRSEMIEALRESVIHIIHTHDGAHVGMQCIWHGTSKDRKVMIRTFKEFIEKLTLEEFGHLPLLAAFDSVDDTVFIKKTLINPIVKLLPELLQSKHGRKVIMYLISPRNPSHFLPETVKLLSLGDGNVSSKKPMDVRHKELREGISPGLIEYITKNIESLVTTKACFTIVEAALFNCFGEVKNIRKAIVNLAIRPFKANKNHLIEDPAGHLLIKRIISHESSETENKNDFPKELLDSADGKTLSAWAACNRGGHVLLSLLECKNTEISKRTKSMLAKEMDSLDKDS